MMKSIGVDSKVRKYEKWLNEIRAKNFIRREANLLPHQRDHLGYPQKSQLQLQEWLLQIHKPLEESRKVTENVHIACRRLKKPILGF
jgi:hypothetical protein